MDMRTRILLDIAVGALANGTGILATTRIDAARLQGCIPRKIRYAVEWRGKTTLEGPLIYGITDDNTAAQVSAWFIADPQIQDEAAEAERSLRHNLILGYIPFVATTNQQNQVEMDFIREDQWPGWWVREGEALNFFVAHIGAGSVTTGLLLDGFLEIIGDWIDE